MQGIFKKNSHLAYNKALSPGIMEPGVAETEENWRRGPELNRCTRFCRPLPSHSATTPCQIYKITPAVDFASTKLKILPKKSSFLKSDWPLLRFAGKPLWLQSDGKGPLNCRCVCPER